jgi:hypothetical protein
LYCYFTAFYFTLLLFTAFLRYLLLFLLALRYWFKERRGGGVAKELQVGDRDEKIGLGRRASRVRREEESRGAIEHTSFYYSYSTEYREFFCFTVFSFPVGSFVFLDRVSERAGLARVARVARGMVKMGARWCVKLVYKCFFVMKLAATVFFVYS